MKRDRDDTESPPPKKSRKAEMKRPDDADKADKADGPPQRKIDDKNDPYWEVSSPHALLQGKSVLC